MKGGFEQAILQARILNIVLTFSPQHRCRDLPLLDVVQSQLQVLPTMSSNTGQRKGNPTPRPSSGPRFGRGILLAGLALGVVYAVFPSRPPQPAGSPGSTLFKTTGVQNVENAYANGGATTTHTKAYGGTVQGTKGKSGLREGAATDKSGGFEQEGMGEEQRSNNPTKLGEAFNEFKYGSSKGK